MSAYKWKHHSVHIKMIDTLETRKRRCKSYRRVRMIKVTIGLKLLWNLQLIRDNKHWTWQIPSLDYVKTFQLAQVRHVTAATAAITLACLFVEMLCYVLGRLHSSCVLSTKVGLHRLELILISSNLC